MYDLTKEQQIVLLCSRVTFDEACIEKVKEFTEETLDWYTILTYCIKNKVVSLVWSNVKKFLLNNRVPNPVYDIFEYYTYLTGLRNDVLLKDAHKVQEITHQHHLRIVPLKGIILINDVYKNREIRHMNDLDFMIDFEECPKVAKPLEMIGYIQGRPNRPENAIKTYTRREKISWGIAMNNMPLFIKQCEEPYVEFVEIDFTFSLDFERKTKIVSDMVKRAAYRKDINFLCLQPVDFFIHLCTHLFKEATNATWIIYHQDLNLIKFCDVREYYLKCVNENWIDKLGKRAKEVQAEKAVYYSLYYSYLIYKDKEVKEYLDAIHLEDTNFLDEYGQHDLGKNKKWKKDFFERIFSNSNFDEIENEDKLVLI